jgi:hypothetical protein
MEPDELSLMSLSFEDEPTLDCGVSEKNEAAPEEDFLEEADAEIYA